VTPKGSAPARVREAKSFLRSKTHAANLLLVSAAELSSGFRDFISTHPQTAILLVAVLNSVLRQASSASLYVRKRKDT
jgi:hypothetical protein